MVQADEVYEFQQADLAPPKVVILDTGGDVYLVIQFSILSFPIGNS